MQVLNEIKIVSTALNLPGPLAVQKLQKMGAQVTKVEPPTGDPLHHFYPEWYKEVNAHQDIIELDPKLPEGRHQLNELLNEADLIFTTQRPSTLATWGLDQPSLQKTYPNLSHIALLGYLPPRQDEPGHDLNFLTQAGLVQPPNLPLTLFCDMASVDRLVAATLALLWKREKSKQSLYHQVTLEQVAHDLAEPLLRGATQPKNGPLGGQLAGYNLYQTKNGWLALGALEPQFQIQLKETLSLSGLNHEILAKAFLSKTSEDWKVFGRENHVPITVLEQ